MRSSDVVGVGIGGGGGWEADRGREKRSGLGVGVEGREREGRRESVESRGVERVLGGSPGEALELDQLCVVVPDSVIRGVPGMVALRVEGGGFGVEDGETWARDEEVGEGEGVSVLLVVGGDLG